jgi:RNA polymerase sigma-70 factor (ECF subfamily)
LAAESMSYVAPGASEEFYNQLVNCLPHLRAFARVLCRQHDLVDDLVQDAVVRALAASNQFQQGTNFKAWMFTILRNQNITTFRRKRVLPASFDDVGEASQAAPQEDALMIEDLDLAVQQLSPLRREALILVAVHGLSYEEAAAVCDCAIGTIKSRVARARAELHEMVLGGDGEDGNGANSGKARRWRVRHLGRDSEGRSTRGRRMCDLKACSLPGS